MFIKKVDISPKDSTISEWLWLMQWRSIILFSPSPRDQTHSSRMDRKTVDIMPMGIFWEDNLQVARLTNKLERRKKGSINGGYIWFHIINFYNSSNNSSSITKMGIQCIWTTLAPLNILEKSVSLWERSDVTSFQATFR